MSEATENNKKIPDDEVEIETSSIELEQAVMDEIMQNELNNMPDDDSLKNSFADGFGMSIDDVRALLAKQHETIVPKDDPLLLTVTILNVFLEHLEKLNQKQLKSMNNLLTERTEAYINGVKDTIDGLSQTLQSITVEGIKDTQEKHRLHLQSFKVNMWWVAGIITLSAFLNVTVFILR